MIRFVSDLQTTHHVDRILDPIAALTAGENQAADAVERTAPRQILRPDDRDMVTCNAGDSQGLGWFQVLDLDLDLCRPGKLIRYRRNPASLWASVNKQRQANGLLPSTEHSLYSKRYAFQDRLSAAEAPHRVQSGN